MFLKEILSTAGLLKKIRCFEIYRQYIGAGCTRSALARQQSFEKVPSSSVIPLPYGQIPFVNAPLKQCFHKPTRRILLYSYHEICPYSDNTVAIWSVSKGRWCQLKSFAIGHLAAHPGHLCVCPEFSDTWDTCLLTACIKCCKLGWYKFFCLTLFNNRYLNKCYCLKPDKWHIHKYTAWTCKIDQNCINLRTPLGRCSYIR